MSKRYWTADLHLGHGHLIDYCKRPFKSIEHMNERLIAEINMRCKPEDTLVHVGDAVTKGVAKGVEGLRLKWADYRKLIHCNVVMVTGNHDRQNKTKTVCDHMVCQVGPQRAFVTHYPSDSETHDPFLIDWVAESCNFVVCGHVHERWKFKMHGVTHGKPPLLNVNVGVDQHNYRPLSDDELLGLVAQFKRGKK